MKRSSLATPGNGAAAVAHRGGEDVVLSLAPSGSHNGELAIACAG
jgi:hypothetical protein